MKRISVELTPPEARLLKELAGTSNTSMSNFFRKCLLEKGRATTPLLEGEALKERLDVLDEIDYERVKRDEFRRKRIKRGNDKHWDEKLGLDTETRKALQKEYRKTYQREWARRKRAKK